GVLRGRRQRRDHARDCQQAGACREQRGLDSVSHLSPLLPSALDCAAIFDSATMMGGSGLVNRCAALIAAVLLLALPSALRAEDGYALWLRYAPLEGEALERLRAFNPRVGVRGHTEYEQRVEPFDPVGEALEELKTGLSSLVGRPLDQGEIG